MRSSAKPRVSDVASVAGSGDQCTPKTAERYSPAAMCTTKEVDPCDETRRESGGTVEQKSNNRQTQDSKQPWERLVDLPGTYQAYRGAEHH